jgi:proline-specific peptidase
MAQAVSDPRARGDGEMKVREGMIDVPDGRVWYRSVGEGGIPLLCLHGGPGSTHNYIDPLEDLADRRQVIAYDQLGCGRSDCPDDTSLWTVPHFVREVEAVRTALELDRFHLFGSSWGGQLSLQYILDYQPVSLVSLLMAGSPASSLRWVEGCKELVADLPDEVQAVIRDHEAKGFTTCPEYIAAVSVFYRRHLCRLDPWPASLERTFAEMSQTVYETMWGPSEFTCTGRLRDYDVFDRLGEIRVPTLVMGGRYDELRLDHLQDVHEGIGGSELLIFQNSSHTPFHEERQLFMDKVNEFLVRVEVSK